MNIELLVCPQCKAKSTAILWGVPETGMFTCRPCKCVSQKSDDGKLKEALRKLDELEKQQLEQESAITERVLSKLSDSSFDDTDNRIKGTFKFTKISAEAGNPQSMYELGMGYYGGLGVPRDFNKALEWFQKADGAGVIEAAHMIGVMYENGGGISAPEIKKDTKKSTGYFERAANAGLTVSMQWLGTKYSSGIGVSIDVGKAYQWFITAAKRGEKHSLFMVALRYAESKEPATRMFGLELVRACGSMGDESAQSLYVEGIRLLNIPEVDDTSKWKKIWEGMREADNWMDAEFFVEKILPEIYQRYQEGAQKIPESWTSGKLQGDEKARATASAVSKGAKNDIMSAIDDINPSEIKPKLKEYPLTMKTQKKIEPLKLKLEEFIKLGKIKKIIKISSKILSKHRADKDALAALEKEHIPLKKDMYKNLKNGNLVKAMDIANLIMGRGCYDADALYTIGVVNGNKKYAGYNLKTAIGTSCQAIEHSGENSKVREDAIENIKTIIKFFVESGWLFMAYFGCKSLSDTCRADENIANLLKVAKQQIPDLDHLGIRNYENCTLKNFDQQSFFEAYRACLAGEHNGHNERLRKLQGSQYSEPINLINTMMVEIIENGLDKKSGASAMGALFAFLHEGAKLSPKLAKRFNWSNFFALTGLWRS